MEFKAFIRENKKSHLSNLCLNFHFRCVDLSLEGKLNKGLIKSMIKKN